MNRSDLFSLRGICFDLDDTLITSTGAQRAGLAEGWRRVFGERHPVSPERLQAAVAAAYLFLYGPGTAGRARLGEIAPETLAQEVAAGVLAELGIPEQDRLPDLVRECAAAERAALQPTPGALSTLEAMQGNVRLGVITNGPARVQRAKLAATGLERFFDVVLIDSEVGLSKPDAALFAHAAARLDLVPEELLFVGDLPDLDVAGADAAGWTACLYDPDGRWQPADVPAARFVLRALPELLQLPYSW